MFCFFWTCFSLFQCFEGFRGIFRVWFLYRKRFAVIDYPWGDFARKQKKKKKKFAQKMGRGLARGRGRMTPFFEQIFFFFFFVFEQSPPKGNRPTPLRVQTGHAAPPPPAPTRKGAGILAQRFLRGWPPCLWKPLGGRPRFSYFRNAGSSAL